MRSAKESNINLFIDYKILVLCNWFPISPNIEKYKISVYKNNRKFLFYKTKSKKISKLLLRKLLIHSAFNKITLNYSLAKLAVTNPMTSRNNLLFISLL